MGLSDTIELKWLDEKKKPEDEDYQRNMGHRKKNRGV